MKTVLLLLFLVAAQAQAADGANSGDKIVRVHAGPIPEMVRDTVRLALTPNEAVWLQVRWIVEKRVGQWYGLIFPGYGARWWPAQIFNETDELGGDWAKGSVKAFAVESVRSMTDSTGYFVILRKSGVPYRMTYSVRPFLEEGKP